ncbi:predicted protein [Postia placenta Mad-698-R]|nr:predicted protein [Postia placenta Mad-698-R]
MATWPQEQWNKRSVARALLWSDCSAIDTTMWAHGEDEGIRTVWDVDVDKVLSVESVNLALTGSHVGWREDGEEPRLRVREDKYRPLKCRKGEGKPKRAGGIRLVFTEAMHADTAPGAIDSNASISGM